MVVLFAALNEVNKKMPLQLPADATEPAVMANEFNNPFVTIAKQIKAKLGSHFSPRWNLTNI